MNVHATAERRGETMDQWIAFEKGTYLVQRAYLFAPNQTAVSVTDAIVEVYEGQRGIRKVKGRGFIVNALLVELLDSDDRLTLMLDLGGVFKYRAEAPELSAGKVFSPGVRSALQFAPSAPWLEVSETEFEEVTGRLSFLDAAT